jgi:undecaprenyl-diphosphatase
VLFRKRFESMIQGVRGKSEEGRQLVYVLAAAFVPAAIVGIALESPIKKHLFGPWPVVEAWFVGGVVILAISRWFRQRRVGGGRGLSAMTVRDGVIVGVVQVLALWPGTSRSLVTILAALFLGCSLVAAVEFSFLLGFFTLTAATGYDLLRHGHAMFSAYGVANPLIGLVVAFLAAMVAIKWMITYLERHQLDIFGYYRIAIAAVVALLLVTNAI